MSENWTPEAWSAFIEPLVAGIRASKTDHQLRVCRCSSCMNSLYYLKPFVEAEGRAPSLHEAEVRYIYFTCGSPKVRAMKASADHDDF
jgi:hypothetical protein